jgi:hypothetical protein
VRKAAQILASVLAGLTAAGIMFRCLRGKHVPGKAGWCKKCGCVTSNGLMRLVKSSQR